MMKQYTFSLLIFIISSIAEAKDLRIDRCQPESPSTPDHGKVWCNNSNKLNSVCMFTCEPYHTLVGGNTTKCIKTLNGTRWTEANPICEADQCTVKIKSLPNGVIKCSRGNKVGSVCHYKCTKPGTSMFSGMKKTNRCMPSKQWDAKPPCCQAPCPSEAKMDAVIIMDTSSSVGSENWNIMFSFVKGLIKSFPVSENLTRFAMFRYSDEVDEESATYLDDYDRLQDGLLYRLDTMKNNGGLTMTGKALTFARQKIFESAANRPDARDLVILFTDGRSRDDAFEPSIAIRNMGGTIIVIGITEMINYEELLLIARDPMNIFEFEGYHKFTDEVRTSLINKICKDLCINTEPAYNSYIDFDYLQFYPFDL